MSDNPRMQWERYVLWGVIVIFLFVVYVKKFKRIELYNYFLKCIYLFGYVSKKKSRSKRASVWVFKRWIIYRKISWYRASDIKSRKSSCDNCKIINKQIFEFSKKINTLSIVQNRCTDQSRKHEKYTSRRWSDYYFVPLEQWIFSGKSYITIFSN